MIATLNRATEIVSGWYDVETWRALSPEGRVRAFRRALRIASAS